MTPETEDLLDLMLARALGGLDEKELDRLDRRLLNLDAVVVEQLEQQLEAALALAGNASALEDETAVGAPPPEALVTRLEADADHFFGAVTGSRDPGAAAVEATSSSPVTSLGERRSRRGESVREGGRSTPGAFGWTGWAVAALLLLTVWVGRPGDEPGDIAPRTPAEARSVLLGLEDTVQTPWGDSAWSEFADVRGDVVWNDARQEGYLRLSNMPANDPLEMQYQLWIVDPARDVEPVDGGIFDIPPGAREVVVPIRAKLAVRRPAAFAITREQPGGVVVSEGPLLVVASRG